MAQSSHKVAGLAQVQFKTFKLSMSDACRRMTADQILDLADHLHAMIRRRTACGRSAMAELARRRGGETASFLERPQ